MRKLVIDIEIAIKRRYRLDARNRPKYSFDSFFQNDTHSHVSTHALTYTHTNMQSSQNDPATALQKKKTFARLLSQHKHVSMMITRFVCVCVCVFVF